MVFGALCQIDMGGAWLKSGQNAGLGSSIAASNSVGPGREVNTTSLSRAAAKAVSARVAPCAHSSAVASGRRSYTDSECRRNQIARDRVPIVPVPTKPIRILSLSSVLGRHHRPVVMDGKRRFMVC